MSQSTRRPASGNQAVEPVDSLTNEGRSRLGATRLADRRAGNRALGTVGSPTDKGQSRL